MKIEFRKVPLQKKEFKTLYNSVEFEGTFSKISQSLVKINATLKGSIDTICCRCASDMKIQIDEELDFLLSDGIYKNSENEDLVIEVENSIIDFDEIVQSELNSFQSDYHICEKCLQTNDDFEKKF